MPPRGRKSSWSPHKPIIFSVTTETNHINHILRQTVTKFQNGKASVTGIRKDNERAPTMWFFTVEIDQLTEKLFEKIRL